MPNPPDPRLLAGRSSARGAGGVSPNRFPASRSAGAPIFPHGSGYRLVPQQPPMPPPMPKPQPAGPFEQESALGANAMVQSYNASTDVGLVSVKILERNSSRKGLIISNPSTTLTIFLNFQYGPATSRHFPLFPLNSIQFFSGENQQIPKDEIYAVASGAGPTVVNVTEFS